MSRIVITGAPGAGKTTLLLALQAHGYTIVGDSARTIIQNRRRRGLSPRPDPYAFAQEALRMDIENFLHHADTPGHVFFERGVLDALCGLDRVTPLNESELNVWLSKYQYSSKVFVVAPVEGNLRERCGTRPHIRARGVGQQDRAGVVSSMRIRGHRGTEGIGCRAVYVCASSAGKERRLTRLTSRKACAKSQTRKTLIGI